LVVDNHTEQRAWFWSQLAYEHATQLGMYGYGSVKRAQALRYFTWRWRPRALARSEQLRFLVRHTGPASWWRALREPVVADEARWAPARWTRAERVAYTYATRLAWEYAVRRGDAEVIALAEPDAGGPLPVTKDGRLISQDLANTSLEVAAIREGLAGVRPTSILEIGAGYGRTAFALLSIFPEASYTVIDIEPALSISRWYLELLFPESRLRFIESSRADALETAEFDLAVSISSLQEMAPEVVASYLALMDSCVDGVVYLKQWTSYSDYPVPARWQPIFARPAPIQTRFTEAMWATP
jgi:putative sugar O-methyltransferase